MYSTISTFTELQDANSSIGEAGGELIGARVPALEGTGEPGSKLEKEALEKDDEAAGGTGDWKGDSQSIAQYMSNSRNKSFPVQVKAMRLSDEKRSEWMSFDEALAFCADGAKT